MLEIYVDKYGFSLEFHIGKTALFDKCFITG